VSSDTWNPDQYARFRDERSRPFYELMALVRPSDRSRAPREGGAMGARGRGMLVADLGCGTGELMRELHRHTAAAETIGLDSSAAMLAKARGVEGNGLRFVEGEIWDFARGTVLPDERFDVIFSNAALQWVDEHTSLITHLAGRLNPGGQLAVQVPGNMDHPAHVAVADVAQEEPFRTLLGGHVRRFPLLSPEGYAELLDALGFKEQDVRLQVFGHHLGGREDVVEWLKGSLLTDYQKLLPPEEWARFLARYRELVMTRLPETRPYFYAFKRILFWGAK